MSLPQIRGMYNGDRARKEVLVEYGFRLPSALDNRPLRFPEFEQLIDQAIFVSATPGDWELEQTHNEVIEQIIRPTGLLDPEVEVRPIEGQIDDLVDEIKESCQRGKSLGNNTDSAYGRRLNGVLKRNGSQGCLAAS